jgi:hypothetical protein
VDIRAVLVHAVEAEGSCLHTPSLPPGWLPCSHPVISFRTLCLMSWFPD